MALGGRLRGSGLVTVSNDSFVLHGSQMPGNSPVLYFQSIGLDGSGLGTVFGDGLRCAGGTTWRLARTFNDPAGSSTYPMMGDPPISQVGQVPAAGGTRYYQGWYRNTAPFCTPDGWNLTNGVGAVWVP
jgi:hypothetical protein